MFLKWYFFFTIFPHLHFLYFLFFLIFTIFFIVKNVNLISEYYEMDSFMKYDIVPEEKQKKEEIKKQVLKEIKNFNKKIVPIYILLATGLVFLPSQKELTKILIASHLNKQISISQVDNITNKSLVIFEKILDKEISKLKNEKH